MLTPSAPHEINMLTPNETHGVNIMNTRRDTWDIYSMAEANTHFNNIDKRVATFEKEITDFKVEIRCLCWVILFLLSYLVLA